MSAGYSMNTCHTNCCAASAAACTSARICSLMGTAVNLVVSILICLLSLRLWAFWA